MGSVAGGERASSPSKAPEVVQDVLHSAYVSIRPELRRVSPAQKLSKHAWESRGDYVHPHWIAQGIFRVEENTLFEGICSP